MADPEELLLLVSILAQTLFALVGRHLMPFVLFSVWHNLECLNYFSLTAATKTLAGLKAGMSCSGMVMVVFWVMLRAAF